jgi:hypothetical protein
MAISNRTKAERYRQLITLLLRSSGLENVTGKIQFPDAETANSALAQADLGGHIWGLPVSVIVRDEARPDWSEGLDKADAIAAASGTPGGVLIQRRSGHEAEESWTVMTLTTFTKLMKEVHHG